MTSEQIDWMRARPTRSGQNVSRGEESAVYNPHTGGLHVLNSSALAIWELCDGSTSGNEMAEAITELTGLAAESAEADVSRTLDQLFRLGLVEEHGSTS